MKKVFKIEVKANYNVEMELKKNWFSKPIRRKKTFNVNSIAYTVAESHNSKKIEKIEKKLKHNKKKLLSDGMGYVDMYTCVHKMNVIECHNENLSNQIIEIEEVEEMTTDELKSELNYKDYIEIMNQ